MRPHARVARGTGYVPQGQQSFTQLTAAENLQLVADGRKRGKALIDESLPGPWSPSRGCCSWTSPPRASSPTW